MSDDVGYKRPPVASQFKKGQSGNPGGRRHTSTGQATLNILTAPISIMADGRTSKVEPFELIVRKLFAKAMKGDLKAAIEVVRLCASAGLFEQPEAASGIYVTVPKDWDWDEWMEMYRQHGFPPWRGPRDGLVPIERRHMRPVSSW